MSEHETQTSISEWQRKHFPDATLAGIIGHLIEEFWEFRAVERRDDAAALVEAADIVILLYAWASHLGLDLHNAIDAKMAVNRTRNWTIQPDGTGRHV